MSDSGGHSEDAEHPASSSLGQSLLEGCCLSEDGRESSDA